MKVNPTDVRCRSCQGVLCITDADDATLSVECFECGDSYEVETDAFGDGGIVYYPAILAEKMERGEDPWE